MLPFEFVIDGPPMSAQSHNLARLSAWKASVAATAAARWIGSPFPAKVRVVVTYYHEGEIARLDSDNMVKPILDALIGIAYTDDRQASEVVIRMIPLDGDSAVPTVASVVAERLARPGEFLHVKVHQL